MFAQVFESASPNYFTPAQFGIGSGPFAYNPYLLTPPRIYAEAITGLVGCFTRKEKTAHSDFTVHVMAIEDVVYFPSYDWRHWWFDGMTGELLGRDDTVAVQFFAGPMFQGRSGDLWAQRSSGGLGDFIFEVDPTTFLEIPDTRLYASFFGGSEIHAPLTDRAQDLFIGRVDGVIDGTEIGVFSLSTGALLRKVRISGVAVQTLPEDERRCYVVTDNDLLSLVDYSTGQILSVLRAPGRPAGATPAGYRLFCWDRYLRRLLEFSQMPEATDGACTGRFRGFYPRPVATRITTPIPLRAPRAGRATAFLTRVYGDAGEGVSGVKVVPSAGSEIQGAPPFTDQDGEAVVTLVPDAPGSDTLEVSATV